MNGWKGGTCKTSKRMNKKFGNKISKNTEEGTAPGGRRRKSGNIKINIKEIWIEGLDWIQVT